MLASTDTSKPVRYISVCCSHRVWRYRKTYPAEICIIWLCCQALDLSHEHIRVSSLSNVAFTPKHVLVLHDSIVVLVPQ